MIHVSYTIANDNASMIYQNRYAICNTSHGKDTALELVGLLLL